jgi:transposase-like protein
MGRKLNLSKETKIEACESYKNGNGSYESIAKAIGCGATTFKRSIR